MVGAQAGQLPQPQGREAPEFRITQRDRVLDCLLLSGAEQRWLTLAEISEATGDPPASISAQIRHLRKRQFGAYRIEKRFRRGGRDADTRLVEIEYRLRT